MRLNFVKNIQLDIQNWQNAINAQGYGVDWEKYIPDVLSVECVKTNKCLADYLNQHYYNTGLIDSYIEKIRDRINIQEIQEDLERLMDYKFPDNIEINVFITTFNRAPYNTKDNSFYLRYRGDENDIGKSITNIYHELMHFLFHWNYWEECQSARLKENQIHDIKESFTVLLNPILAKRNLPVDKGYKIHQGLREKITELQQKNKDLKHILEKIIKELENN
jgi:hypothetical protein